MGNHQKLKAPKEMKGASGLEDVSTDQDAI
jgi:hypothetical protein